MTKKQRDQQPINKPFADLLETLPKDMVRHARDIERKRADRAAKKEAPGAPSAKVARRVLEWRRAHQGLINP